MLRQPPVKGNTAGGFIRAARAELESVPLQDCSMVVSPPGGWTGRAECFWALISTSPELARSLTASLWAWGGLSSSLPLSLPSLTHTLSLSLFLSVSLTQSGLRGTGIFFFFLTKRKVHRSFQRREQEDLGLDYHRTRELSLFSFFYFFDRHGEMERAVCSLF